MRERSALGERGERLAGGTGGSGRPRAGGVRCLLGWASAFARVGASWARALVWAERHAGQAGALSGGESGAGPKQREMGPVCWAETEGWAGRVGKERGRAGLDRVLSERAVCVTGPGGERTSAAGPNWAGSIAGPRGEREKGLGSGKRTEARGKGEGEVGRTGFDWTRILG